MIKNRKQTLWSPVLLLDKNNWCILLVTRLLCAFLIFTPPSSLYVLAIIFWGAVHSTRENKKECKCFMNSFLSKLFILNSFLSSLLTLQIKKKQELKWNKIMLFFLKDRLKAVSSWFYPGPHSLLIALLASKCLDKGCPIIHFNYKKSWPDHYKSGAESLSPITFE